jgi:NH3-dependent NAD+ synthetase
MSDFSPELENLISRVRTAVEPAPALYVPVSGGSDSALVFWLLNQVAKEKTVGLYCVHERFKNQPFLRCRTWFERTGNLQEISTSEREWEEREEVMWGRFLATSLGKKVFNPSGKPLKAGWLVGCRNQTEHLLGTYSLASRIATFLPIVNVSKTDVLNFCAEVAVPQNIIDSSRKADPDCGRPKEMAELSLGFIDQWLEAACQMQGSFPNGKLKNKYLEQIFKQN